MFHLGLYGIISRLYPQRFLMFHTRKYNFDISGESNQRNKFVKCFEHYFSGRKFIVYVYNFRPLGRPLEALSADILSSRSTTK